jgi:hypothetical protein
MEAGTCVIGYGDKENVKCISLKACFNKCRFWCGWCFIMWVSSLWLYHLNEPDEENVKTG